MRIFDEILAEFPDLIQKFEYNAAPGTVRSQIAAARHKIHDRTAAMEQDAAEETRRGDLMPDVDALSARSLLATRIEEAERWLMENRILTSPNGPRDYQLWRARVGRTLTGLYLYHRNANEFSRTESLRLAAAFLHSLDDELSLQKMAVPATRDQPAGNKIFIGHGRSLQWRTLKDFVEGRLDLRTDEFNREPPAGLSTVERLTAMLKGASFAFLIMTGEDEQPNGNLRARENVIHEIGLFQGRLGFHRAIILLEKGCEEFSNKHGLTDIRFPKGQIDATFENIRATLEREGIIAKG